MNKNLNRGATLGALALAGALALTSCSGGDSGSSAEAGGEISGDILFYDTSGGDVWERQSEVAGTVA